MEGEEREMENLSIGRRTNRRMKESKAEISKGRGVSEALEDGVEVAGVAEVSQP